MPELPEVESVARALRDELVGRTCHRFTVHFPGLFEPSAAAVRRAVLGRTLLEVHRHGKYLVLTFAGAGAGAGAGGRAAAGAASRDGGGEGGGADRSRAAGARASASPARDREVDHTHVMVHLRMTGQFLFAADEPPDAHVHLSLDFDGRRVCFRDIRKFGRWTVVDHPHRPSCLAHVGPDVLEIAPRDWLAAVAPRRAPFKSVLLDQSVAAGIGNIYADEALLRARIHPLAHPCDLPPARLRAVLRAVRQVMRLAIAHGGTTIVNFANTYGEPGAFRRMLRVYGRTGAPCRACGEPIVRIVVGGRSTHFCPRCQAAAASLPDGRRV